MKRGIYLFVCYVAHVVTIKSPDSVFLWLNNKTRGQLAAFAYGWDYRNDCFEDETNEQNTPF